MYGSGCLDVGECVSVSVCVNVVSATSAVIAETERDSVQAEKNKPMRTGQTYVCVRCEERRKRSVAASCLDYSVNECHTNLSRSEWITNEEARGKQV